MAGEAHGQHAVQDSEIAPRVENPGGSSPVLLVCEHASAHLPQEFESLGLGAAELQSHIAWDPGALDTAKNLSKLLNAPLVHSRVSRLLYDCNRPPDAESAVPERSEDTQIPGNLLLSEADRELRVKRFYRPFETLLAKTLAERPETLALVTIHSFTPVFSGERRSVEIGILHDSDSRLAEALLHVADGYEVRRNAPYGPQDGVTHTLREHALPRNLLNVMIEIRNDLIETSEQCSEMADLLAGWLIQALEHCNVASTEEAEG